jgi:hypothetical protein
LLVCSPGPLALGGHRHLGGSEMGVSPPGSRAFCPASGLAVTRTCAFAGPPCRAHRRSGGCSGWLLPGLPGGVRVELVLLRFFFFLSDFCLLLIQLASPGYALSRCPSFRLQDMSLPPPRPPPLPGPPDYCPRCRCCCVCCPARKYLDGASCSHPACQRAALSCPACWEGGR